MYGGNITAFAKIGNVKKFLAGLSMLEERGAPEATMMLVSGIPGLGKSATARWHVSQQRWHYVVMKPNGTLGWLLDDICATMGFQPPRTVKERFKVITAELMRTRKGLVIDEAEHTLANAGAALEGIRAIGDLTEVPIILVGREFVGQKLQRIPAVSSRVTATVNFQPLAREDFELLLTDYKIPHEGDVAGKLATCTKGLVRLGMNELRRLHDWSARNKGRPVTPEQI